jgi:hypothetical protein
MNSLERSEHTLLFVILVSVKTNPVNYKETMPLLIFFKFYFEYSDICMNHVSMSSIDLKNTFEHQKSYQMGTFRGFSVNLF